VQSLLSRIYLSVFDVRLTAEDSCMFTNYCQEKYTLQHSL